MIKRKTVFVLGAGASMPYGLPSGATLRDKICEGANDGAWITEILRTHVDIDPPETREFARAFLRSNVASIDSFLSRRSEFMDIGKMAIAACLCDREIPDQVYRKPNGDDWYHLLWNKLIEAAEKREELAQNQVRFITFNYDRSLEYFLQTSTKNTYGGSDEQAFAAWRKFEILHVYGKLGEFGYQPGNMVRQYSENLNGAAISVAAHGINLIPEARHDDKVFMQAREWFDWAECICFLGFGFDPLNVDRLGLESVLAYKLNKNLALPEIIASVYGKTDAEEDFVKVRVCFTTGWHAFSLKNCMTLRQSSVLN